MIRLVLAALFATVIAMSPALAVLPGEQLADPKLEARARALGHELRCLVCQNQSIDESDASLARDLRLLVRERISAGDSDEQVRAFLVARYGEFILLKPRLASHTLLLWGLPLGALLVGGIAAAALFRRKEPSATSTATLSDEETAALRSILEDRERP